MYLFERGNSHSERTTGSLSEGQTLNHSGKGVTFSKTRFPDIKTTTNERIHVTHPQRRRR